MKHGAFARAADPVDDACAALARGVDPERVATWLTPAAVRQGRLAALRAALAEHGADRAVDRALELRSRER